LGILKGANNERRGRLGRGGDGLKRIERKAFLLASHRKKKERTPPVQGKRGVPFQKKKKQKKKSTKILEWGKKHANPPVAGRPSQRGGRKTKSVN